MLKQKRTGKIWGYLMQIAQQEAFVFQSIVLVLSVITTASVLQIRGYAVPVWLLAIVAIVVILAGGVAIWLRGLPSYFSAFNDQFYKHDNMLRQDIEKIKSDNEKILKLLEKKAGVKDD